MDFRWYLESVPRSRWGLALMMSLTGSPMLLRSKVGLGTSWPNARNQVRLMTPLVVDAAVAMAGN
eukprot:2858052-Alexandrium_andersonii.AAC.1